MDRGLSLKLRVFQERLSEEAGEPSFLEKL